MKKVSLFPMITTWILRLSAVNKNISMFYFDFFIIILKLKSSSIDVFL